jgi:hypothetical protein
MSPLETYAQVLGVQNQQQQMQQRQQLAPLQLQDAQQTAQAGQIDLQQKQLQQKDQQAMSATMQQWGKGATSTEPAENASPTASAPTANASKMPSYDDLVPLAIKNGASFPAVQALQAHVLDMKAKASTIAMDDARAGASNADAMKAKSGMIVDAMTGVMSQPDELLPQAIQQTAQELAQKGLFDPPHVQQAMQLAMLARQNPAQARQQLDIQAKSLGGFSKLLEDAQKSVAVKNEQGKTDPNSPLYSPSPAAIAMGTAPGAAQIQAGEAKQAGVKAGAEAAATQGYKLSLAQAEQSIKEGDPNSAAKLLINSDVAPSQIVSSWRPEFAQKVFQAAHDLSGGKWNAQDAEANYQVAKSPANVAFFGSAKSLTDKGGTLDQLATTGKTIPQNQMPVLNSIADWEKAATGSGPIAKFAATALGVADDYAKVMGGGQGSDTSRLQALKIIAANQSPEARAAAIEGIRGAVNSQKGSRIGNNSVLQRMYGDTPGSDPFAQFGGKAH